MQRFYTNIQVHKYIQWYLLIISSIVVFSIVISFNHIFTLILQLFALLSFEVFDVFAFLVIADFCTNIKVYKYPLIFENDL